MSGKVFKDARELQPLRSTVALVIFLLFSFAAVGQSPKNPDIRHLLERAQQGYVKDQIQVALAFEMGSGVAPDHAEAARWFLKAAHLGDPLAQTYIAYFFLEGKGVTQNPEQAFQWFQRAAV